MGCCQSNAIPGSPGTARRFRIPFRDHISKFLEDNHLAHAAIIAKGPLLPFHGNGNTPKQAEQLPRSAFRLYDMNGNETEFRFETEGIFSHPASGPVDRVFYNEIYDVRITPIPGHERSYTQITFDTKLGFRTYFYLPIEYKTIILRVVKSQS
jgi:hypothetical protein